jgi:hypothetical protein
MNPPCRMRNAWPGARFAPFRGRSRRRRFAGSSARTPRILEEANRRSAGSETSVKRFTRSSPRSPGPNPFRRTRCPRRNAPEAGSLPRAARRHGRSLPARARHRRVWASLRRALSGSSCARASRGAADGAYTDLRWPKLRLVVRRYVQGRPPPMVRHGDLRKRGEEQTPLRAKARGQAAGAAT